MKELLLRLAQYNVWANQQFFPILLALNEEQVDRHIMRSYPSIRKTVLHLWGAEDLWLQRFESVPQPEYKPYTFAGSFDEIIECWKAASAGLLRFTKSLSDAEISGRIISGVNMKGVPYADSLNTALQHVFNHASYHRGAACYNAAAGRYY